MPSPVAATILGLDYQGRLFLRYLAELRIPDSNVASVAYEFALLRAFDDIVVTYRAPEVDDRSQLVDVDFFQVKFQLRQGEQFTGSGLMDPRFINAKSVSLLERLRDAVREERQRSRSVRFRVVAPRPIGDDLRPLISNRSGHLDLDLLFDKSVRTPRARLRKNWCDHLQVDEAELRDILAPLRIETGPTLEELKVDVALRLRHAGLKPWGSTEITSVYDDLPRKLATAGVMPLDRVQAEQLLQREKLVVGAPMNYREPFAQLAIRSFVRHAEKVADQVDGLCCLVDCFEGRDVRKLALWEREVLPRLESFTREWVDRRGMVTLRLDVHATIAFAAGWYLDSKAPLQVTPIQSGTAWVADRGAIRAKESLAIETTKEGEGEDLAVLLSLTHDVRDEAEPFVRQTLPAVGTIISIQPVEGPSAGSVRDGTHAFQLCAEAVGEIVRKLPRGPQRRTVHFFCAAPIALLFFLGQQARRLGRVALYEHDFERTSRIAYLPSVTLTA